MAAVAAGLARARTSCAGLLQTGVHRGDAPPRPRVCPYRLTRERARRAGGRRREDPTTAGHRQGRLRRRPSTGAPRAPTRPAGDTRARRPLPLIAARRVSPPTTAPDGYE